MWPAVKNTVWNGEKRPHLVHQRTSPWCLPGSPLPLTAGWRVHRDGEQVHRGTFCKLCSANQYCDIFSANFLQCDVVLGMLSASFVVRRKAGKYIFCKYEIVLGSDFRASFVVRSLGPSCQNALSTRTPPQTSSRPWHGSVLGVTNASAEHLPRGGHRHRPDPAEFLAIARI